MSRRGYVSKLPRGGKTLPSIDQTSREVPDDSEPEDQDRQHESAVRIHAHLGEERDVSEVRRPPAADGDRKHGDYEDRGDEAEEVDGRGFEIHRFREEVGLQQAEELNAYRHQEHEPEDTGFLSIARHGLDPLPHPPGETTRPRAEPLE